MNQSITWLLNEKYQGQLTKSAQKDIARLKAGEPVDYVIGYKDFLGCQIDLRYRPLIPREETEFWVNQAISDLRSLQRSDLCKLRSLQGRSLQRSDLCKLRCLDIFAGSGCCGLAVLKRLPKVRCDFADNDSLALKQIRFNLKLNNISPKRCKIIKSDVFERIKGCYDLILANPPYIAVERINRVQKSALKYEPKQALIAKERGLFLIKKFLKEAKQYLTQDGIIYMEFDSAQKKEIEQLLKKYGYSKYQFSRDQFNHWRYLKAAA